LPAAPSSSARESFASIFVRHGRHLCDHPVLDLLALRLGKQSVLADLLLGGLDQASNAIHESLERMAHVLGGRDHPGHEGRHQAHLVRIWNRRFLSRGIGQHHLGIGQFLLHRPLHHVLVDAPKAILSEQLLEVPDRVGIRCPLRLRKTTHVPSRRVVLDLVLGLPVRHPPRCAQHQRARQRSKTWRTPGIALDLAAPDRLDQLQQLRPVDLVRHLHQAVVLRDRDDRPLRTREQIRLPAALPSGCRHVWSPRASRCSRPASPPGLTSLPSRSAGIFRTNCSVSVHAIS